MSSIRLVDFTRADREHSKTSHDLKLMKILLNESPDLEGSVKRMDYI